jgi:hypothetical protein
VCRAPALTAMKRMPGETSYGTRLHAYIVVVPHTVSSCVTPSCPSRLLPQQKSLPSPRSAQVWSPPALTAFHFIESARVAPVGHTMPPAVSGEHGGGCTRGDCGGPSDGPVGDVTLGESALQPVSTPATRATLTSRRSVNAAAMPRRNAGHPAKRRSVSVSAFEDDRLCVEDARIALGVEGHRNSRLHCFVAAARVPLESS